VGFEALTRWQIPERVVLPGEFIAVADEIGLILPINCQLLRSRARNFARGKRSFPLIRSSLSM
jgi:EAL domain-containing protein (putative c-di-GMP-specific phosphodiesterase class I)